MLSNNTTKKTGTENLSVGGKDPKQSVSKLVETAKSAANHDLKKLGVTPILVANGFYTAVRASDTPDWNGFIQKIQLAIPNSVPSGLVDNIASNLKDYFNPGQTGLQSGSNSVPSGEITYGYSWNCCGMLGADGNTYFYVVAFQSGRYTSLSSNLNENKPSTKTTTTTATTATSVTTTTVTTTSWGADHVCSSETPLVSGELGEVYNGGSIRQNDNPSNIAAVQTANVTSVTPTTAIYIITLTHAPPIQNFQVGMNVTYNVRASNVPSADNRLVVTVVNGPLKYTCSGAWPVNPGNSDMFL